MTGLLDTMTWQEVKSAYEKLEADNHALADRLLAAEDRIEKQKTIIIEQLNARGVVEDKLLAAEKRIIALADESNKHYERAIAAEKAREQWKAAFFKAERINSELTTKLAAAEKERDECKRMAESWRQTNEGPRRDFTLTAFEISPCLWFVRDAAGNEIGEPTSRRMAKALERWSCEGAKVEESNVIHPGLRNPEGASSPEPQKETGESRRWMANNRQSSSGQYLDNHWEDDNCSRLGCYPIKPPASSPEPAKRVGWMTSSPEPRKMCHSCGNYNDDHTTGCPDKPPAPDLAASWEPFDRLKAALNEWKRLDNTHSLAEAIRQLILAIVNDEITITKPPAPDLATLRERVMRSFRFMASEEQIDALRDYFLACVDAKENKS